MASVYTAWCRACCCWVTSTRWILAACHVTVKVSLLGELYSELTEYCGIHSHTAMLHGRESADCRLQLQTCSMQLPLAPLDSNAPLSGMTFSLTLSQGTAHMQLHACWIG